MFIVHQKTWMSSNMFISHIISRNEKLKINWNELRLNTKEKKDLFSTFQTYVWLLQFMHKYVHLPSHLVLFHQNIFSFGLTYRRRIKTTSGTRLINFNIIRIFSNMQLVKFSSIIHVKPTLWFFLLFHYALSIVLQFSLPFSLFFHN
jgi:hypothetical protein